VHFRFLSLILLGTLALSSACSEAKSERCKKVCQQETDCAEQRSRDGETFPYDLDECIAACVGLERDSSGREKVEAHIECANSAGDSCEKLLTCRF
jgi:hypothetical protein